MSARFRGCAGSEVSITPEGGDFLVRKGDLSKALDRYGLYLEVKNCSLGSKAKAEI